MQTGQVSVWVPLVVGIIGLIGVIAGQFVSAWREDRRWTREQLREDERWKRELEREKLNRESADRTHWRDKKFEIYNDFLSFMKKWRDLNYDASVKILREGKATEEQKDDLYRIDQESFEHRDRIELIATNRTAQDTLLKAISTYLRYAGRMNHGKLPIDVDENDIDEFTDANEAMINVCLAAIRVDLGISDEVDRETIALLDKWAYQRN